MGKWFLNCKNNDTQPCSLTKIINSSSSKPSLYDNSFLLHRLALLSPACLSFPFCRLCKHLTVKHLITLGGNQLDQATPRWTVHFQYSGVPGSIWGMGQLPNCHDFPCSACLHSHHQEPPQTPSSSSWSLILHVKGILCSIWTEKGNWSLFNQDALCPEPAQDAGRHPGNVPKSQTKHKATALHIHNAHLPINFAALTFLNKSPDWKGND